MNAALPAGTSPAIEALYDVAATRRIEARALRAAGGDDLVLMRRAGAAAFAELRRRWPRARRIAVVCGRGNNGGDGMVVAELAHDAGLDVSVYTPDTEAPGSGTAQRALQAAVAAGVVVRPLDAPPRDVDVVVDALFGIGLDRAVDGVAAAAIEAMNAASAARLALDVPSGLAASSGAALPIAVRADVTVTFITAKPGLFTGAGRQYAGAVVLADLDTAADHYADIEPSAARYTYERIRSWFRPRERGAHKGHFGHVLVVGGAPGYAGAARLAAEAAARSGAGLVSLATHPDHAAAATLARPEIMTHAVADGRALRRLVGRANVLAIGPGLGQEPWGQALFAAVSESRKQRVVDADALNLLAREPAMFSDGILTPHPGEAARLLDSTSAMVEADRAAAASAITRRYGGVVVLKGAGTIVAAGDTVPAIIDAGNPGMASGGMGDVLTGVIAALVAQGFSLREAAIGGAVVHAHAADLAVRRHGERGLLAGDLPDWIRRALNPAQ